MSSSAPCACPRDESRDRKPSKPRKSSHPPTGRRGFIGVALRLNRRRLLVTNAFISMQGGRIDNSVPRHACSLGTTQTGGRTCRELFWAGVKDRSGRRVVITEVQKGVI